MPCAQVLERHPTLLSSRKKIKSHKGEKSPVKFRAVMRNTAKIIFMENQQSAVFLLRLFMFI